jgi:hypothetical protein
LGLDVHSLLPAKLIFILFHIIDRSLKTEKGKKDGKRRVFLKLDARRKKAEKDGRRRKKSAILTIVLRPPY